jgi:sigma-E factor negative regulatory protein RseA
VIQDELESQLSAMFDGELPVTECELLSRRIDRDEILRARWSRYALIGAAMRSEPVATARSGFARRVSIALRGGEASVRARRGRKMIFNAAMSASLVAAVAGISISMLRYTANGGGAAAAHSRLADSDVVPVRAIGAAPAPQAVQVMQTSAGVGREGALLASAVSSNTAMAARHGGNSEPVSYVTPASAGNVTTALRTELADFIVAHSEYSTPLMRRNLLSALVTNEDGADSPVPGAAMAAPAVRAAAGAVHATIAASGSSR